MSELQEIINRVAGIKAEKHALAEQVGSLNRENRRLSNEMIDAAKEMAAIISELPSEFQEELKSQLSIIAVKREEPI